MRRLYLPLTLGLLASFASARQIGEKLTDVELDGLSQTEARSFDDLVGRAVLLEFFAYW